MRSQLKSLYYVALTSGAVTALVAVIGAGRKF